MNHYQRIKKCDPPCFENGICEFGKPDLWVSNHYAWELWQKCSSQVIVAGMGDVLGIKFEAIAFIFDLYEIYEPEERQFYFEKIQIIDIIRLKSKSSGGTITNNKGRKSK